LKFLKVLMKFERNRVLFKSCPNWTVLGNPSWLNLRLDKNKYFLISKHSNFKLNFSFSFNQFLPTVLCLNYAF
jgi:hypothetical protein